MSRVKSFMRSYFYLKNMDRVIENTAKACKSRTLVAKAPPIILSSWPKTDRPLVKDPHHFYWSTGRFLQAFQKGRKFLDAKTQPRRE